MKVTYRILEEEQWMLDKIKARNLCLTDMLE